MKAVTAHARLAASANRVSQLGMITMIEDGGGERALAAFFAFAARGAHVGEAAARRPVPASHVIGLCGASAFISSARATVCGRVGGRELCVR